MKAGGPQYTAALSSLGTNAVPFLLNELQARNSLWSRCGARVCTALNLDLINWDFAHLRRYHAALALQFLDTNAAPAMLDAVFARPMVVAESDLGCESAMALSRLYWQASSQIIASRLTQALRSPSPADRRNACLVFYFGVRPTHDQIAQIGGLARDLDDGVRAAAMRALMLWFLNEPAAQPALVAGLQDPHPAVRLLAAQAIEKRGSNALSLAPALHTAHLREPTLPRPTNAADFLYQGAEVLSITQVQTAIAWALKQVDPHNKPGS